MKAPPATAGGTKKKLYQMVASCAEIWRYPVKGLAGERLGQVQVRPGQVLPLDRRFAVAHGDSGIEASTPRWALKTSFHMLMHGGDEGLAALTPSFDDRSDVLTILHRGKPAVRAKPDAESGQAELNAFFARYLGVPKTGAPRFMAGKGLYFGNVEERVISLINHASVADLARTIGGPVDARRFRANFYVDGIEPWTERKWVGKTVRLGDLRFAVVDETIRCGATTVDPATSARNLNVPKLLQNHYGHMFCGVYLKALDSGTVSEGATVTVSAN